MISREANADLVSILHNSENRSNHQIDTNTPLVWYEIGLTQTSDGYYIPAPHYYVLFHGTKAGPLLLGIYTSKELQDPQMNKGYYFCHPMFQPWDPNNVLPVASEVSWTPERNQRIIEIVTYKTLKMIKGDHKRYHMARYNCKHFIQEIIQHAINQPDWTLPGTEPA